MEQHKEPIEAALEQHRQALLEDIRMGWLSEFDGRQRRLIANCRVYAENDPVGLPGHNLMVIIAKMAEVPMERFSG